VERAAQAPLGCFGPDQFVTSILARRDGPERDRIVDWLTLLECVLRNPFETKEEEIWWIPLLDDGAQTASERAGMGSHELVARFPPRYLREDRPTVGNGPAYTELALSLDRSGRLRREREESYR
jgi:hypothetical protein